MDSFKEFTVGVAGENISTVILNLSQVEDLVK